MRLIIKKDYQEVSQWAALYIANKINKHKDSLRPFVLGLPTGSTPLGTYKKLIELYQMNLVSFKNVVTFNMDEYLGLDRIHPQSYHTFMWANFFNHIDIDPNNVNILNGATGDPEKECFDFEEKMRSCGGIDLFLGGVGSDGHIAFNEPGSSLNSRTRIKSLTRDTVIANARFFNNQIHEVPRHALTVGVATVMDAKEVLIIATGHNKARALQQGVEGSVNQMWTITALQLHQRSIVVCDEDATIELKVGTYNYFKEIETNSTSFKP